jgi:hypothetical protein
MSEPGSLEICPRVKRIAGISGVPNRLALGEGQRRRPCAGTYGCRTPRGLRGWHARTEWQQKPGTARGWPRRSRTAEAAHISRYAMKLCCAREWGGWGRLSVDGLRQHNSDRSEDPWGRRSIPPHGGAVIASTDPTLGGSTLKHEG